MATCIGMMRHGSASYPIHLERGWRLLSYIRNLEADAELDCETFFALAPRHREMILNAS